MFCPNCATRATEGQRFCRSCGANLGAILDAIENKRGALDFDSLKNDLRELGTSLRAGFEEAKQGFNQGIKRTHRFQGAPAAPEMKEQIQRPVPVPEPSPPPILVKLKNVKGGSTRRYSLAHATLSIFGGGGTAAALFYLLRTADESGFLANLEQTVIAQNPQLAGLTGLIPVIKMLWILGLLPVVKGFAHLLNGIFFAATPEPETKEVMLTVPYTVKVKAVSAPAPMAAPAVSAVPERDTNELLEEYQQPPLSVTEEETIRLGAANRTAE